jgi:transposase
MARPYSNDLRDRVAAAVVSGRSCREVAQTFDVSVSSAVKWSQRLRATGTAAANKMGGHRKVLLEPHRELVLALLDASPDMTMAMLVADLAEHGVVTSTVSVWRLVRSAGKTFKKNSIRRRARAASDRAKASAVAEIPGPA